MTAPTLPPRHDEIRAAEDGARTQLGRALPATDPGAPREDARGERPGWLPHAEYPFTSRFAEIEGNRIHYVDEGAGPAILLVNVGFWSLIFRDLMIRLRGRFRVISLDFPGLGLSTASTDFRSTVPDNSRILESFVDALDLQDLTLLVHDVGGPVGLGLAARQPERIRALVIAQTFAFPLRPYPVIRAMLAIVSSRLFDAINARTNVLIRLSSTRFGVGRYLSQAGREAFMGPWADPATRRMTIAALRSVRSIDDWMSEIESALSSRLNRLPVLTVYGGWNDPWGWQARLRGLLPNSRHLRIARGIHFPFDDAPDDVADAIESWWEELVARPGLAGNDRA